MPTVSVIVPNYNHARFLRRRLATIFKQSFQDFEVILLDDNSTDSSRSILREYALRPQVRLDFNNVNSGSTFSQWNKGVGLARGKYVWIAESDDYADARLLERLVPLLDSDPAISFAYCRSRFVTSDDQVGTFVDCYLADPDRWTSNFCQNGREACCSYFLPANPIANASAVLFRKEVYEQIGGADQNLRLCGDWKVWAAMALMGKIAYICEPLNYFRLQGGSVRSTSGRAATDVREYLAVTRWIMEHVTITTTLWEKTCDARAELWVPAILSLRVPLSSKRAILDDVRAMDPYPLRRVLRPAVATARRKVLRHWRQIRSLLVSPAETENAPPRKPSISE
jgi:glycosyltransferase involved in cell wall biosynthesis